MISGASFLLQNANQFERLGHQIHFFPFFLSYLVTNEMQKMNQFMLKSVASFSFNPVCGFHFNHSAARRSGPCLVLQCTVQHLVQFLSGPNKCPSFQFTCICFRIHQLNPIPTGHGRNQPIYERHVTKSGRNRVKSSLVHKNLSLCTVTF